MKRPTAKEQRKQILTDTAACLNGLVFGAAFLLYFLT